MRIAVIGAGIAGLTAARDLALAGQTVSVFEAAPQAGGLASGFKDERWHWPLERFYHHIFTTDSAIRQLASDTGYGDKLFFRSQITAQWWRGQPRPLQGGLDSLRFHLGPLAARIPVPDLVATALSVARFPGLSLPARARMGLVSAYLKYLASDWRALESHTAANWTRRWMGDEVYKAFVQPLLEGKFGPYAEEVNMAWLWARLKTRSFKLGYFEGGFQGFADCLMDNVKQLGVQVRLGTSIRGLEHADGADGGWRTVLDTAQSEDRDLFDAVIATVSPKLLGKLVPRLPATYLHEILALRSMGAIVLTVALRRPLTKACYWINMPKDQFPFLALVEHTNFVGPEHYGGDHLVYCGDYLDPAHEYFTLSPEQLLDRFVPALQRVNSEFDRSWIRAFWLHREGYAQPIVPVRHSHHVPALSTPLPGLLWASMSHVYPWDRGTNFAVELGHRVANEAVMGMRPS